ncbi:MAG: hypothetical protein ABJZ55_05975 [Fuerstiella sp.]
MITKAKFKSDTYKFFSTGRSRALKRVDDAIETYHQNQNRQNVSALAKALVNWGVQKGLKTNGDIDTGRNQRVIKQLIADVAALPGGQDCANFGSAVKAATPAQVVRGGSDAFRWVSEVSSELDDFSTYACMDAGNFPQCIKAGKKNEVQARRLKSEGKPPMVNVIQPGQYEWKGTMLRMRYQDTQRFGKQGECTSFGYLAAYVLTKGRPEGPRVELVAHKAGRGSHVYVLVGRAGGLESNGMIPEKWDAVVVDAWAASLGHPCVYKDRGAFPFQGMTKKLELVMARGES